MNESTIPIFREKLKKIKKQIKKHLSVPKDKINRAVVKNLLNDANRLKKVLIQFQKKSGKEKKLTICPHCGSKLYEDKNTLESSNNITAADVKDLTDF